VDRCTILERASVPLLTQGVILRARLKEVGGKLTDLLFPPRCVGCGTEGDFICATCRGGLPRLSPPFCPTCGRPLIQEEYCSSCRRWKLDIDGIRSPFAFQGALRQAIHRFKYGGFKALALPLAQLLAQHLEDKPLAADVLVPVPLHPRRLRERGYNQSRLLAQELCRLIEVPVAEDMLFRHRNNRAQVKTPDSEERRSNVLGAFGCRDDRLKGGRILLIDDVCTTGATLNSCASALREGGAGSIWGLALAREV
jgi:ComF family protein